MKPNPVSTLQPRLSQSGVLHAAMAISSSFLSLMAGFTVAVILVWPG